MYDSKKKKIAVLHMEVWLNKNRLKYPVKQTLASFKGVAETLASKVIFDNSNQPPRPGERITIVVERSR